LTAATDDIQTIIEGCIRNDRKAQERLYKQFYGALGAICMRYTKSEQDAIELLNDGFLKIFKNIQQYDKSKGALYTWMSRIVTNCCIDFLRKQQEVFFSPVEEHTDDVHLDNTALQQMDAQELLSLIRQLPPATKLVFNLHVIEGYPHKEIADMLKMREGTSKWHVNEARKLLQKKIHLLAAAS
jgi:RNA polymerase sigma-70 factor (ECF subfamily)